MYLIPLVRTTRAISACTLFSDNPILAISVSEIISYTVPFINNSPLYAANDIVLFLFYYYYYNESALQIIEKFKNKYLSYYQCENLCIFIYLLNYFYNKFNI